MWALDLGRYHCTLCPIWCNWCKKFKKKIFQRYFHSKHNTLYQYKRHQNMTFTQSYVDFWVQKLNNKNLLF